MTRDLANHQSPALRDEAKNRNGTVAGTGLSVGPLTVSVTWSHPCKAEGSQWQTVWQMTGNLCQLLSEVGLFGLFETHRAFDKPKVFLLQGRSGDVTACGGQFVQIA